jgi:shikimate dehydrogenase
MRSAEIIRKPTLFGIIGYPLHTTWSPAIYNAAFNVSNLPFHYAPFAIAPARLKRGVAALADLGVKGFNVTVPHKEAILPFLASASELVRTLGAANTVVARPRGWHGENTDVVGFTAPLYRYRRQLAGRSAVVLGAGGAARAVLCALLREFDLSAVLVVARNRSRAEGVAHWAQSLSPGSAVAGARLGDSSNWRAAFREAALVVQATPVGSVGSRQDRVLPAGFKFNRGQIACDLVYGRNTDFLIRAHRGGAVAQDGSGMLLAQAAAAFEVFTGASYPWRAVGRGLLRRRS